MIAFSGLEELIRSNLSLIDVVEIEPQTFWRRSLSDAFKYSPETIEYLKSLDRPLLFHGVGHPVGGSLRPDGGHLEPLLEMAEELRPRWMSEHLSFNTVPHGDETETTAFLLPPLQTAGGVKNAVAAIEDYQKNFSVPFAFETGVNYLKRRQFDLDDGAFIGAIAEQADCHILLDLHNIMANELNGRQSVEDFIAQIPRERVVEMHLAGGFYSDGYYLDAHSGISSEELLTLAEKVAAKLPALKAIIFEMLPDYQRFVQPGEVTAQLERMHRIWEMRGREHTKSRSVAKAFKTIDVEPAVNVIEWEDALGNLSMDRPLKASTGLAKDLLEDKGLQIIRKLSDQFKNGSLFKSMRFTCRYLGLKFGEQKMDEIFADFWAVTLFRFHPTDNGMKFADYLLTRKDLMKETGLRGLVAYEKKLLLTVAGEENVELTATVKTSNLLAALGEFKLPGKNKRKLTAIS